MAIAIKPETEVLEDPKYCRVCSGEVELVVGKKGKKGGNIYWCDHCGANTKSPFNSLEDARNSDNITQPKGAIALEGSATAYPDGRVTFIFPIEVPAWIMAEYDLAMARNKIAPQSFEDFMRTCVQAGFEAITGYRIALSPLDESLATQGEMDEMMGKVEALEQMIISRQKQPIKPDDIPEIIVENPTE